ncbi:hypothetical protein E2C01_010606 [Portunus trituberculatus]|uniref:Uncharacterized protein n=1 Tax=Portunus trituberculatus TaxID=210409 RepID=A0A5B7D948_PORTR|nr:hypothetical protein [Portunus trituberculatus]
MEPETLTLLKATCANKFAVKCWDLLMIIGEDVLMPELDDHPTPDSWRRGADSGVQYTTKSGAFRGGSKQTGEERTCLQKEEEEEEEEGRTLRPEKEETGRTTPRIQLDFDLIPHLSPHAQVCSRERQRLWKTGGGGPGERERPEGVYLNRVSLDIIESTKKSGWRRCVRSPHYGCRDLI